MNLWRDIFKSFFQERNKDLFQRMIILSQKGMNRMYFQELRIRCKETPERLFFRRNRIPGAVITLLTANPPLSHVYHFKREPLHRLPRNNFPRELLKLRRSFSRCLIHTNFGEPLCQYQLSRYL